VEFEPELVLPASGLEPPLLGAAPLGEDALVPSEFARWSFGRSGSESEGEPPPPDEDEELAAFIAAALSSAVPFLFIVIVLNNSDRCCHAWRPR
jgi:hypothetical protein